MMRSILASMIWAWFLAGSTPAWSTPPLVHRYAGISEYRLDNGLTVLLFPDATNPKITLNITYLVGSRHEGYGEKGMAHLLEHLAFKSTKKFSGKDGSKTPVEILNELGGSFNGTTSLDRTNYFITLPASDENLELILDLESERMSHAVLDPNDLWNAKEQRGEMTVVRNEFEQGENDPFQVTFKRLLSVAFDWHNYGNSTIGNRSDIEGAGIDSLRAFYARYYQPDNAVLVVAGRFDAQKALDLVERYFADKPKPTRQLTPTYTREPPQDGERQVTVQRQGHVPLVMVAYKMPPLASLDGMAAEVLSAIIGATPDGRLYQDLVEHKLASHVAAFTHGGREPSILVAGAMLGKNAKLATLEKRVLQITEAWRQRKITADEVNRAKQALLASWEQAADDSGSIGVALSEYIALGDWRLFFAYRQVLEGVTAEQVQNIASTYLTASNRTIARFVPTKHPSPVPISDTADINKLLALLPQDHETYDDTSTFATDPLSIEKSVLRQKSALGIHMALLPKKALKKRVMGQLTLGLGTEASLQDKAKIGEMTASMLRRGTINFTRQQLKDRIQALRSSISVEGDAEAVNITFSTKKSELSKVLSLIYEIAARPIFPQKELKVLLEETRSGLEYTLDDPRTQAWELLIRILKPYPRRHVRYSFSSQETLQSLDSITRGDLVAFHKNFYAGAVYLAVVGDFDAKELSQAVDSIFPKWPGKQAYTRIDPHTFNATSTEKKIRTPGKDNAEIYLATNIKLQTTAPDYASMWIANHIMGGGSLKSRLADRIRQREGLSYAISSSLTSSVKVPVGTWSVHASANPKNLPSVRTAIEQEIHRALAAGFTDAEVKAAQRAFQQSLQVFLGHDGELASTLIGQMLDGRSFEHVAELAREIVLVDAKSAAAAFRRHIDPAALVITMAGDLKDD